jgi:heat shock protein HslJ
MLLRRPLLLLACCALFPATALLAQSPDPASGLPLKASGNEPAWTLDIGPERLTFITEAGATRIVLPLPSPTRIDGGRRYEARSDAHTLTASVLDTVCVDSMSGLPRPHTVEVTVDGKTLKGCAGDASLLVRGAWQVDGVGGNALVNKSRITLDFDANGRLTGSATCNRYVTTYLLTGEGLTVTMPISTMRGCAQALMRQEQAFLAALRDVRRFELTADGALVLHSADGTTITARRDNAIRLPPGR